MGFLGKHFPSSANISLSIHKNEKITRTVPLQKSNSTKFKFKVIFMMDIKIFTTCGVRGQDEGGGTVFLIE